MTNDFLCRFFVHLPVRAVFLRQRGVERPPHNNQTERVNMNIYAQIYEFAASAGALEGYVYRKRDPDMKALPNWVNHLLSAYWLIPKEILSTFQPSVDATLGRAVLSLTPVLGEAHEIVGKLKSMVTGDLPETADAFRKTKWFEKSQRETL
jgi:hypothetical protein